MTKIKLIFGADLNQLQDRIDEWYKNYNIKNILNTSLVVDKNQHLSISIVYNEGPISL